MSQRKLIDFFVTGFFSGYSPFAPGTCGTIVSLVLYWFLFLAFPILSDARVAVIIVIPFTLFAIAITNKALELALFSSNDDPGEVVIDEFVGAFVALIGSTGQFRSFLLAFVLFRLFDIVKPPPIRRLEKLPRGAGIVLDDVLAGIYASIVAFVLGKFLL